LDFTLWRPRELIHLCGQILDVAKKRRNLLPFEEQDINIAVRLYARERFGDVVAEFRFQYPGLASVLETFRRRPREISRDEIELHCLRLATGDLKVGAEARWCLDKEPDELIETLWRIGFLRAEALTLLEDNSGGERAYVGSYQVRTANIGNASKFMIHDMFATYLECS